MAKLCYVCNKEKSVWRENLCELKMNHSNATVGSLLKNFLCDTEHRRNVDDSSNCICIECFEAFDEYDCIREMVRLKEQQLRMLFLATEKLFISGNSKLKACETPVNDSGLSGKVADIGEFRDELIQDRDLKNVEPQIEEIDDPQDDDKCYVKEEWNGLDSNESGDDSEAKLQTTAEQNKEITARPFVGKPYTVPSKCNICNDGKVYQTTIHFNYHLRTHKNWCDLCDVRVSSIRVCLTLKVGKIHFHSYQKVERVANPKKCFSPF